MRMCGVVGLEVGSWRSGFRAVAKMASLDTIN